MAALWASTGVLLRAVRHAHDVDVAELGAAFAPVGVGHDVVAADLAAGSISRPGGTAQWKSAL